MPSKTSPLNTSITPVDQEARLPDETSPAALWSRYMQLTTLDAVRNKILEDALAQCELLSQQVLALSDEVQRQRTLAEGHQARAKGTDAQLDLFRNWILDKAFAVILLDGNGMFFEDQLVQAGAAGGKQAADVLFAAASTYVSTRMPDLQRDVQIIARIFVDFKALTECCLQVGIVDNIVVVQDFFRGFTNAQPFFDVIDVGSSEQDGVFNKIADNFLHYESNAHCQQLLLGCSHDDRYTQIFDHPDPLVSKVTLLEGLPVAPGFLSLPFAIEPLDGLFRRSRPMPLKVNTTFKAGPFSNFVPSPRTTATLLQDQATTPLNSPTPPPALRNASISSADTGPVTFTPPPQVSTPIRAMSWASAVQKPAPPSSPPSATASPRPSSAKLFNAIPRNKAGQRVDPSPCAYDKAEVDRVKKLKMCNVHFLQQKCPYGNKCTHIHEYKPTHGELQTLRLVARMAPCHNGSGCEDVGCIYGHRCPAPDNREKGAASKAGKTCIFEDDCRFAKELHGLDTVIVKRVTVK